MKRKNMTRNALVTSILALLVCVSMLVGTTFAWFTDSVVSGMNTIAAGNLDVELLADGEAVKSATKLFNLVDAAGNDTWWEPGMVVYENLQVANVGTLALKYQMSLNFGNENAMTDGGYKLSDILKVAVIDKIAENATRAEVLDAAKGSDQVGTLADFSMSGELEAGTSSTEQTVVIFWEPNSNEVDNLYNANNGKTTSDGEPLHIEFGVFLQATQKMFEEDSFGNDYDKEAKYPVSAIVPENAVQPTSLMSESGNITVKIPVEAKPGLYQLEVNNEKMEDKTYSADISLSLDGVKVPAQTGVKYLVEITIGQLLDIQKLLHNGQEISGWDYDPLVGILSFETDSFSPFAVEFVRMAKDAKVEDRKIVFGIFDAGYNPADIDKTLLGNDSEYIAINYKVDGMTCYVVSKRDTTKVVAADAAADYIAENGNYTVTTNRSGELWSLIRDLQNNEHSTVYLLPGTYNEGTTINVYSSMDIIGLGDKDAVKVFKVSSSDNNRHLFNCNGTKADYIEVTLRNLYLDATATTTNGKDNAAVQSIRKTKVKCYDLTIVKGTGWDAVAFYVNGNNAVDGVKHPAYLYVENCSLNTTRTFGVVTTAGSYKFYHTGLTYGGTAYTNNSGSIKNQMMEPNDWVWD